jgi:glycosyltransferase involved in cell wall biosynthesis
MPSVSVVLLAHQAAKTLEGAVESVKHQEFAATQLLIADLGSLDSTAHLAAALCESTPGAELHVFPPNRLGASLNALVDRCTGDVVAFLAATDRFAPAKLKRQLAHLLQNPSLGGVASHVCEVDAHYRPLPGTTCSSRYNLAADPSLLLRHMLCDVDSLCVSSVMVTRQALRRVGRFAEAMTYHVLHHFWLRLQTVSSLQLMPEPLTSRQYVLPPPDSHGPLAASIEAAEVLSTCSGDLIARHPKLTESLGSLYEALIFYAYRGQAYTSASGFLWAKKERIGLSPREVICLIDCLMHQHCFKEANAILIQVFPQRDAFEPADRARIDELIWHLIGVGHQVTEPFEGCIGLGMANGTFYLRSQRLPD